jgi:hypothetical protein
MKEICIPVPEFLEQQIAEVEVKINGRRRMYNFRVESFPWEKVDGSVHDGQANRIKNLRKRIEDYDPNWELVQIFQPRTDSEFIQVLFRQRRFE